MKNFVRPGDTLKLTAPYARSAGQCAKIGTLIVCALTDLANGEVGEWLVRGVITHEKVGSQAWTEGAKVYWDDTEKEFTTTSSGNTLAGVAAEAVGSGSGATTGTVYLDGVGR